jgi:pyrroline-5-carboxylate reductase
MTDTRLAQSFPAHLFLVGCGNMAGQMLAHWLNCGLDPARVTVLRPSGKAVAPGVTVVTAYPDRLPEGTLILLGMKPYQIEEVAAGLAPLCRSDMAIVSILAGTTLAQLRGHFPASNDVIRAMPNLPVGIGKGVTALFSDARTQADARAMAEELLGLLGLVEWMDEEAQFNSGAALSGCGPAFLFRFIDALALAGEAVGLPADQSARMALATVEGAAGMAAAASDSPAMLADRVASPGGMTREGMNVLDADDRLVQLLIDTLTAARDRGEAMARG